MQGEYDSKTRLKTLLTQLVQGNKIAIAEGAKQITLDTNLFQEIGETLLEFLKNEETKE